jgi:pimeloyl-ACP methyl ester carboxylesterase
MCCIGTSGSKVPFVTVASQRLEYRRIGIARPGRPTLVFLHEGLGSVAMWRDFPARVARATRCSAVVYSRRGYGKSEPLTEPRTVRYMHDEAERVLPELIDRLAIDRAILIGHSDGGSIALIHAATAAPPPLAIVTLAAHVLVEELSVASIAEAREKFLTTDVRKKLARHHADVDAVFWGWNRIWLAPEFRAWNIEEYLPRISCPVLAIQGEGDEYGTMEQMRRIAAQVPDVELVMLPDCRHSAHKDQPDAVIDAIARLVERVTGTSAQQRRPPAASPETRR